jgi:hypothetical protein
LDKNNVATVGITRDQLLNLQQAAIKPAAIPVAATRPAPLGVRPAARPIAALKAECVEVIRNGTLAMSCF